MDLNESLLDQSFAEHFALDPSIDYLNVVQVQSQAVLGGAE